MPNRLTKDLAENEILVISDPINIFYFTKFKNEVHERIMHLVLTKNKNYLILPMLDLDKVDDKLKQQYEVIGYMDGQNPYESIKKEYEKLYFEDSIIFREYKLIKDALKIKNEELIDSKIRNIRSVKTLKELEILRVSAKYADRCIEIAKENLKVGITEIELKNIIENEIKKEGIERMAFDTMVLFSENAANPHGISSNRQFREDDYALIDVGCFYKDYASDITRVIYLKQNPKYQKIYDIVLKANQLAIEKMSLDATFSDLDNEARGYIKSFGYDKFFTHRLGHGIGITCHEYPDVASYNQNKLLNNVAFTIEPGIYIKDEIGIRIEDTVVLVNGKVEILTKYPK